MAIASSSKVRVAYVPEATYGGGPPSTPSFKVLRRTGGNLTTEKTTAISDEVRADRNVPDEYQLAQDVKGSYDFELTYGTFDDFIADALNGTWATNSIVNASVDSSLTLEETTDIGGGAFAYHEFDGCVVDQLDLTVASRGAIKGTASLMGLQEVTRSAIITGATYTAANNNPVMTASAQFASLAVAGLTPIPKIKTLSLSIKNNTRIRDVVGSLYSQAFGVGQFEVTGSFEAYFETLALWQQVLAHGGGALTFTLGSTTLLKYAVNLPQIIFLNGARQLGGKNNDVMVSVPFRAVFNTGLGGSIGITRAVA